MSRVSTSDKQDTNQESVSYLVLYSYNEEGNNLDYDSYIITDKTNVKEIIEVVLNDWNNDIEIEHLRIIPFYRSQIKRIKQTLELV